MWKKVSVFTSAHWLTLAFAFPLPFSRTNFRLENRILNWELFFPIFYLTFQLICCSIAGRAESKVISTSRCAWDQDMCFSSKVESFVIARLARRWNMWCVIASHFHAVCRESCKLRRPPQSSISSFLRNLKMTPERRACVRRNTKIKRRKSCAL